MLIAGAMSVLGIIGPAVDHFAFREIGIIGYAIVWPIVCLPLSKAFGHGEPTAGPILPVRVPTPLAVGGPRTPQGSDQGQLRTGTQNIVVERV
jgi:hypothetical protein